MRKTVTMIVSAAAVIGAAPPAPRTGITNLPAYEEPAQPWRSVEDAATGQRCRDRVEQARAAAGKPRLDRGPATTGEPLLMYAVDRRVDGCGVLVPANDPADIRHPPEPGTPELMPAQPRR